MTDDEKQQLLEMGRDLAAAQNSPWEPACISRAFSLNAKPSTLSLTMQSWIDLDAIRSPLLQGGLPEEIGDVAAAAEAFGLSVEGLEVDECVHLAQAMQRACTDAFKLALKMKDPRDEGGAVEDDGFGGWLPLWACLITQCGLSLSDARTIRVDHAYALMAAMRRNDGWKVAGVPHSLREMVNSDRGMVDGVDPDASLNAQPSTAI